ncbi:MAG: metalloregulator ArsR/SmtB family transcription factor [Candidatus Wallbacteria bacterium]|nr:metalloregulator ArsR/SmtB family transcription factor [Candidatus Wallbacteria bacterium]
MSKFSTVNIKRFSTMFKALSNPTRLRIFLRLTSCCEPGTKCTADNDLTSCIGELGKNLGVTASTVSHHIKELHHAGLIELQRKGQKVECWIEPETLHLLADFFS